MELLVNDLSLHGQYSDMASFREAVKRLMAIREKVMVSGRELYCHRNLASAAATSSMALQQAVQALQPDERRSLMQWLTRQGPFWEDLRHHSPDDYLECGGNVVTDTALGEAAWCCLHGMDKRLVSFSPSDWTFSPVAVDWVVTEGNSQRIEILNFWDSADVASVFRSLPAPIVSWRQLQQSAIRDNPRLTFAGTAFDPLDGQPFSASATQRLQFIFGTLNRLKACFDEKGQRTAEGHQIYQDFFTGKKGFGGRGALFSDSSDTEKVEFKERMTFPHPDAPGTLFCPMHGKVQTPQLRVHFSWPIQASEPLYIVYIGLKLTKS